MPEPTRIWQASIHDGPKECWTFWEAEYQVRRILTANGRLMTETWALDQDALPPGFNWSRAAAVAAIIPNLREWLSPAEVERREQQDRDRQEERQWELVHARERLAQLKDEARR